MLDGIIRDKQIDRFENQRESILQMEENYLIESRKREREREKMCVDD